MPIVNLMTSVSFLNGQFLASLMKDSVQNWLIRESRKNTKLKITDTSMQDHFTKPISFA